MGANQGKGDAMKEGKPLPVDVQATVAPSQQQQQQQQQQKQQQQVPFVPVTPTRSGVAGIRAHVPTAAPVPSEWGDLPQSEDFTTKLKRKCKESPAVPIATVLTMLSFVFGVRASFKRTFRAADSLHLRAVL